MSRMSIKERREVAALIAKVSHVDPATGSYPRWTRVERDRWRELARKDHPAIQFAPSTEEMARLFGHRSQRDSSR